MFTFKTIVFTSVCFFASNAFHFQNSFMKHLGMKTNIKMMNSDHTSSRSLLNSMKVAAVLVSTFGLTDIVIQPIQPVNAISIEAANEKLGEYSLPPMLFVPPGFQPIVSEYGRGNSKTAITNPIVVQFCAPSKWIVEKINVNANGEAGKIAANDYIKGDSSFMFVTPVTSGDTLSMDNKQLLSKILQKSVSQKGDNTESFKVNSISQGQAGVNGQSYILVDFQYKINTEAGFLVSRRGQASFTNVGTDIQTLVTLTTDKRYKKLEETVKDVAKSFRVYKLNSGVFST